MSGGKARIAPAPARLLALVSQAKSRSHNAAERLNEETPEAVAEAERWIRESAPEAIEGDGGDLVTFQVAAKLFDLGLDRETAIEQMLIWNENKARPDWGYDELVAKIDSAMRNRQRPIGVDNPGVAPAGMEDYDFGPDVESLAKAPAEVRVRERKKLTKKDGWETLGFFEAGARAYTHGNDPLVDGLLDEGTMSVIYGESNSGKSFVKMDMDYHIAMGLPWRGMATTRGQVLLLSAEGGNGIYKRVEAVIEHYKPEEDPWFTILQRPLDLLRPDGDLNGVLDLIKKTEDATGRPVAKITIDTVSRVLAGGNENSSEDMGQLVRHFDLIRQYSEETHLSLIHHCGKVLAAGARGHSLLRAATDTEIEVTMAHDFGVKKQRDLETKWTWKFDLKDVVLPKSDRRGRTIKSAVVVSRVESSGVVEMAYQEREVYDAIIAKMAKDKLPPGTQFDGAFVYDAAKEAGLKRGFKGQIARQRDNPSWQRSVGRSRAKLEFDGQILSGENGKYIMSF